MTPDPQTQAVIVAAPLRKQQAIRAIIDEIDANSPSQPATSPADVAGETTHVFTLGLNTPASVAAVINELHKIRQARGLPAPKAALTAETNKLSVTGTQSQIDRIKAIIIDPLETHLDHIQPTRSAPTLTVETVETIAQLATLSTDSGRAWAARTLFRERLALLVAAKVKEARIDDARKLADALAAFAPDFTAGVQMAKALADAVMTPAERDKQIAALADEARKPIETAIRHDKAMRRLHPELRKLVKSPTTQPAAAPASDAKADLTVTVLAKDTQPDTLAALKQAGFKVEAVAERAKLAVGRVAPDKLEDVASLDVVRKIDPDKP